jgi:hypothetical protein
VTAAIYPGIKERLGVLLEEIEQLLGGFLVRTGMRDEEVVLWPSIFHGHHRGRGVVVASR